jgi:hypothetical protein
MNSLNLLLANANFFRPQTSDYAMVVTQSPFDRHELAPNYSKSRVCMIAVSNKAALITAALAFALSVPLSVRPFPSARLVFCRNFFRAKKGPYEVHSHYIKTEKTGRLMSEAVFHVHACSIVE